jgi:hypothetical protein
MRKIKIFILPFVIFSTLSAVNAQESDMKYIFGRQNKTSVSGFLAPIMEYSALGNEFAFFMGGGGAILLNQSFFFGGYGEGLTTSFYQNLDYGKNNLGTITVEEQIEFGHGGFWTGYIYKPKAPIHGGVSSRFGWGTIQPWNDEFKPNDLSEFKEHVFVFIPQLEVEFNFFKWMKVNVGAGYRLVTGIDKEYSVNNELVYDKKDFSKPQATMSIIFGFFK